MEGYWSLMCMSSVRNGLINGIQGGPVVPPLPDAVERLKLKTLVGEVLARVIGDVDRIEATDGLPIIAGKPPSIWDPPVLLWPPADSEACSAR